MQIISNDNPYLSLKIMDKEKNIFHADSAFGNTETNSKIFLDLIKNIRKTINKESQKEMQHSNYINYQEVITINNTYYLIREDIDLVPLIDYIKKEELSIKKAAEWIITFLEITKEAQKKELIWSILPPESFWIDIEKEELYIIQPSVIKEILPYRNDIDSGFDILAFTPPEIIENENWTKQSTLYYAGILFYLLLTGSVPFEAEKKRILRSKIMHITPPQPRIFNPCISSELNILILELLKKNPQKRKQTIDAIISKIKGLDNKNKLKVEPENTASYLEKKEKSLRRYKFKEKTQLFLYGNWKWLAGTLLFIFVVIPFLTTTHYTPVITDETPPQEVVEYFYEGLSTKNLNLMEETAELDQIGHIRTLAVNAGAIEGARSTFFGLGYSEYNLSEDIDIESLMDPENSHITEPNDEGEQTTNESLLPEIAEEVEEKVFYISELEIDKIQKTPNPAFNVKYLFNLNWPEEENRIRTQAPMEDIVYLELKNDQWKITEFTGSIIEEYFFVD